MKIIYFFLVNHSRLIVTTESLNNNVWYTKHVRVLNNYIIDFPRVLTDL